MISTYMHIWISFGGQFYEGLGGSNLAFMKPGMAMRPNKTDARALFAGLTTGVRGLAPAGAGIRNGRRRRVLLLFWGPLDEHAR